MRRLLVVVTTTAIGLSAWVTGVAPPAGATTTTITVTSNADTGGSCTTFPTDCTLRQAFAEASSGGAAQAADAEIVVEPGVGTIGILSELTYDGGAGGAHTLRLVGNGVTVTRTGSDPYRLIRSAGSGMLTVDGLTLTNGHPSTSDDNGRGGAILAAGDLTLTGSRFEENRGFGTGGAVDVGGNLTAADAVFAANGLDAGIYGAGGAAAWVVGSASLTRAVFVDSGDDAVSVGADATVTDSTFERNGACYYKGRVGAIHAVGHLGIVGSTFIANCGTVGAASGESVTIVSSTFVDNRVATNASGTVAAPGPVSVVSSTFTQDGTALGYNSMLRSDTSIALSGSVLDWTGATLPYSLCSAPSITSFGGNFANETANTCLLDAAGDSSDDGNDPSLSALADNGGPTQTRKPREHSPLIDWIPAAACGAGDPLAGTPVVTDQRGYPRPERPGGACDVGAVEVQFGEPLEPAPPVLAPQFTG